MSWRWRRRLLSLIAWTLLGSCAYTMWSGIVETETRRKASVIQHLVSIRVQDAPDTFEVPRPDEPVGIDDGPPIQCPLTKSYFVWKTAPFAREEIAVLADLQAILKTKRFFACSKDTTLRGYRCFVFPGDFGAVILKDDQVDWETQMLKERTE